MGLYIPLYVLVCLISEIPNCLAMPDNDVTVIGSTVAPAYFRKEGTKALFQIWLEFCFLGKSNANLNFESIKYLIVVVQHNHKNLMLNDIEIIIKS